MRLVESLEKYTEIKRQQRKLEVLLMKQTCYEAVIKLTDDKELLKRSYRMLDKLEKITRHRFNRLYDELII